MRQTPTAADSFLRHSRCCDSGRLRAPLPALHGRHRARCRRHDLARPDRRDDRACCTRLLVLVTPRELGGGSGSDAATVRDEARRHRGRIRLLRLGGSTAPATSDMVPATAKAAADDQRGGRLHETGAADGAPPMPTRRASAQTALRSSKPASEARSVTARRGFIDSPPRVAEPDRRSGERSITSLIEEAERSGWPRTRSTPDIGRRRAGSSAGWRPDLQRASASAGRASAPSLGKTLAHIEIPLWGRALDTKSAG